VKCGKPVENLMENLMENFFRIFFKIFLNTFKRKEEKKVEKTKGGLRPPALGLAFVGARPRAPPFFSLLFFLI